MSATGGSSLDNIDKAKTLLREADSILIGAGAGLSAAAGLLYMDEPTFRSWFPLYAEKYGLRYIYEAAFFDFPTVEESFGYWANHIQTIRHRYPAGKPYLDLAAFMADRNCFVLTTNVDGQFVKAGFPEERVLTPQGDYAFFQCSRPCSDELYPNAEMTERMLARMPRGSTAILSEDVPHCPKCGALLEPNLRKGANFVEAPWLKKYEALSSFLQESKKGKLVLLELGVGFNTPGIIRYPFERLAVERADAALLRVNQEDTETSVSGAERRLVPYKMEIGAFLNALVHGDRA